MASENLGLSWFDRLKIFITPKSHAEATVDAIYSPENRGIISTVEEREYDPSLAREPEFFVQTKRTVTKIADTASASLKKYLIIFIAVIVIGITVWLFGFMWLRGMLR